jgi:hypothetical protein
MNKKEVTMELGNMKKIGLILFTIVCVSSFCFAEETATAVNKTTAEATGLNTSTDKSESASPAVSKTINKPDELKTFEGKVDSLSICKDVLCGNMSEIVVVDADGQKMTFAVRNGIGVAVSGKNRLVTLKDIKDGEEVILEYITSKVGAKKVMTIELKRLEGI